MSSRRQHRVSTLAIVLPHPPLLRRRSSLLSQGSVTSPHTPRTSGCGSPTCQSWLFASNHRKSSDSWNSSNQDLAEACESEWKPEQVLLLSRTLDALPAPILTPFNGPIPPSNLLDKIARGVAHAKGAEWSHSLRATRVKLIEIARQRAKGDSPRTSKFVVTDENDDMTCYSAESDVNVGLTRKGSRGIPKRPLYRQSSMDFMNLDEAKNVDSINRLSTRLQRTENLVPNSSYHPYTRSRARAQTLSQTQPHQNQMARRSSSPPRPAHVPSLISPSTPSSSTLNSLSSLSSSAVQPRLQRSASFITSDSSLISENRSSLGDSELEPHLMPSAIPGPVDPRVQRVRRSDSFCTPPLSASRDGYPFPAVAAGTPAPSRQAVKRAPSYGTLAQEAREKEKEKRASGIYSIISKEEMDANPCPSSDEEEKLRNKQAKKSKGPGGKPNKTPSATSDDKTKAKKRTSKKDSGCVEGRTAALGSSSSITPAQPLARPGRRMNLERNPSILGAELPHLRIPASASRPANSPSSSTSLLPPATPAHPAAARGVEPTQKVKTLRRVKRLAPSRRISFGSLAAPSGEDADVEDGEEQPNKLGSAFQLA